MKRLFCILLTLFTIKNVYASPKRFGDLAEGPYDKLVIQNIMVIPGHGGPPVGPYDIVIEKNMITEMTPLDPVTAKRRGDTDRAKGDRLIDGTGLYAMPGMSDLHMHLRKEPMEIEYVYYLKLAHGVTTLVPAADRGLEAGMSEAEKSKKNEILAPRLFPIWGWGRNVNMTQVEKDDPKNADKIVRRMIAQGAHVVSVGGQA